MKAHLVGIVEKILGSKEVGEDLDVRKCSQRPDPHRLEEKVVNLFQLE